MKYALIITGVLAGLVIAIPDLVMIGYVAFIVPGLILTAIPTIFVYLAATAVIRRLLPISSSMTATAVAFGIAMLLGWAVMQPFRWTAIAAYHADELPDALPGGAIELDGQVRLERLDQRRTPECDYLGLALLDSPRVQSLTTVTAGRGLASETRSVAAYALVAAKDDSAASIFPHEPGQIVREYPPLGQANRGKKFLPAIKAVEANWALRLRGNERLREVDAIEATEADWVIRIESRSKDRTSVLRRITILDSARTVRFRKSYRKQAVPARMFCFGFHGSMSGSASFHIGHQVLRSGERSLKPESALLEALKFSVPRCDATILAQLRRQTVQALDDPDATPARLGLARRYLGLIFFNANAKDHELIARIVADERVRDIETPIKNVFSRDKTPAAMRDAYVDRIYMDHTSASLRHWLAERLASFPPGTFANPDAKLLAIWDSPEIYQQAAPLIATLADLGPDRAMPKINEMLDTSLALPHWRDRNSTIDGIRAALIRLGPQASAAAPRIRELFLSRPSPIMNNSSDADQWRFALARMGVAIEDLPVLPNQSPKSVERNLRQVSDKMRRYEQENATREET
ncbi:MAG: hypothetical protein WBD20_06515 [Pirellulaceae bacterium]